MQALLTDLKAQKATVVAITHRSSLLMAADRLLVLQDGAVLQFGTRDEVLASVKNANQKAQQAQQAQAASAATPPALAAPQGANA